MSVKGYLGPDGAHLIGANRIWSQDGKIIATSEGNPLEVLRRDALGNVVSGPVEIDEFGEIFNAIIDADENTIIDDRLSVQNMLRVKKNPGIGEYDSVATAVAAVTSPSITNPWVIRIGPGVYTEPAFSIPTGVTVRGDASSSVIIEPVVPNATFITMLSGSTMHHVTVQGANGVGGVGVLHSNGTGVARVSISDVIFDDNETHVSIFSNNVATPAVAALSGCTLQLPCTTGVRVESSGGLVQALVNGVLMNQTTGTPATDIMLATGSGSTLFVSDGILIQPGGNGITVTNGARLFAVSMGMSLLGKCFNVPAGGTAPIVNISGFVGRLNTVEIDIAHTTATGSAQGAFVVSSVSILSPLFSFFSSDPAGGITFTGDLSFGPTFATRSNYTSLLTRGPTMGLISGGTLTSGGGTTVNIAAGTGYYYNGSASQYKTWSGTSTVLGSDVDVFIYYDSTGTLTTNTSRPVLSNSILLGRVVTRAGAIFAIDSAPMGASNPVNKDNEFFRDGLGPVYISGSITTENATAYHLNVTAGSYYFGSNKFSPTGGTNINFTQLYRDGLGGWTSSVTNVVNNTQWDNGSGTLVTASSGTHRVKHALYLIGDGVNEKYFMVFSQQEYASLAAAVAGPIPTPPSFLRGSTVLIAALICRRNGVNFADGGEITDSRPRIGFSPAAVASATVHANLTGLVAPADDHTQYVLISNTAIASSTTLTNRRMHLVTSSSAWTLTLPAPDAGLHLVVKDASGGAQTNNITIVPPGAQTIDGAASYVLNSAYQSVTIISNGSAFFVV